MDPLRIRLIAPSGYPHDRAAMARGMARLEAAGGAVEGKEALDRTELRFAGSDAERAAELNALARDEHPPHLAMAVRGGYGATRLLEHVDWAALGARLRESGTLLMGHSDFTAIQLALHALGGAPITFGGPMLGADFGRPELHGFMWEHCWRTLGQPTSTARWTTGEQQVDVEGPLWGGNLAVLCSLIGTPYFPRIDGGILYVEDIGEPPFRIERLLYQLKLSGVLDRQQALLLGHFTHCRPAHYDNGYDLPEAFAQLARETRVPVVHGLPWGHEPDKLTLPFGAPARLRVAGGSAELSFSGYPHLPASVVRPDPGRLPEIT